MDEKASNRMDMIDLIAQGDMTYRTLLQELRTLEKRYNEVLSALSREEQNIICDFVSQCEEISYYVLQLACSHMQFP